MLRRVQKTEQTGRENETMAKPNYQFEKRSREMAQKKKKEEKRLRKLAEKNTQPAAGAVPAEAG